MNEMSTNHKPLNSIDNHTCIDKGTIKLFLDGFRKYFRLFNMNSKNLKKNLRRVWITICNSAKKKITRIDFVKLVLNTVVHGLYLR